MLVHDGADLVAEGVPALLDLAVPDPPTADEAAEASRSYAGFTRHFFPGCFVCGPERDPGDGLRIFPGWVPGRDLVAAPGRADPSLPAEAGFLATEIAWSFLDCPGAWAMERDQEERPVVLGRMAARLLGPHPDGGRLRGRRLAAGAGRAQAVLRAPPCSARAASSTASGARPGSCSAEPARASAHRLCHNAAMRARTPRQSRRPLYASP